MSNGERGARGRAAAGREEDAEAAGAGRAGERAGLPRGPAALRVQRRGRALGPPQRAPPPLPTLHPPRRRASSLRLRGLRSHCPLALRRCTETDRLASGRDGQRFDHA